MGIIAQNKISSLGMRKKSFNWYKEVIASNGEKL